MDSGRLPDGSLAHVAVHSNRLRKDDLASSEVDIAGREVYLCGPLSMEELALQGVKEAGIDTKAVHRENFAY
jgi:ferredoxin-NADP reductase